jgi:hypothetical protein
VSTPSPLRPRPETLVAVQLVGKPQAVDRVLRALICATRVVRMRHGRPIDRPDLVRVDATCFRHTPIRAGRP